MITFAVPSLTNREFSSAGSEHLPYKQRVGGSNPSTPTTISYLIFQVAFFVYRPHLFFVVGSDFKLKRFFKLLQCYESR